MIRHGARLDHQDESWADTALRPQDSPLAEEGKRQASRLGKWLYRELSALPRRNIVVYSSPFLRCVQTSVEICRQLELEPKSIRIEDGLAEETKWMSRNGKCTEPWFLRAGDFSAIAGDFLDLGYSPLVNVQLERGLSYPGRPVEGCPPGSDPAGAAAIAAFEKRCVDCSKVILENSAAEVVLLVGHGATMWSYCHAFDPEYPLERYDPKASNAKIHYTSCSDLERKPGSAAVYRLGTFCSIDHDKSIARRRKDGTLF